MDADGKRRANIAVGEDGTPHINMVDDQGKNRVKLFLAPDGTPQLQFFDEQGNITWKAE